MWRACTDHPAGCCACLGHLGTENYTKIINFY
jgi:hypothetical protein